MPPSMPLLDRTSRPSTPAPSASTSQTADDDAEERDDTVNDRHDDAANAADYGHYYGADCLAYALELCKESVGT